MTHLTLTGMLAGYPLCGCDKHTERVKGAKFQHAMFADLDQPDICQHCLSVWYDDVDSADVARQLVAE